MEGALQCLYGSSRAEVPNGSCPCCCRSLWWLLRGDQRQGCESRVESKFDNVGLCLETFFVTGGCGADEGHNKTAASEVLKNSKIVFRAAAGLIQCKCTVIPQHSGFHPAERQAEIFTCRMISLVLCGAWVRGCLASLLSPGHTASSSNTRDNYLMLPRGETVDNLR